VSYPFVMTALTVPATTLALALGAMGSRLRALLPPGLETRVWKDGKVLADRRRTDVLLWGSIFAPLVVIALPSTPIFGGTKHWIAAYPFLALYAGHGFWRVMHAARELVRDRVRYARWIVRGSVAALLLLPAALETMHSHPFGIGHYTFLAGGTPGAADLGMNRQFWGVTHGSLASFLRDAMPEGGTVWICDARAESWEIAQRDGLLPENVRPSWSLPSADFVLVHHEHHFAEVDFQAWVAFGTVRPALVLTHDGVPLVSVYESPRHAARAAAQGPGSGIQRGPTR
jgi:hypothetical protein